MLDYYQFTERCRRQGVKANFSHAATGDYFVLTADEAAVTAQLGRAEEEFLSDYPGGLAGFQDDKRHRRQEEEAADTPHLRAIEEQYAAELGVSPEALSAERVRQGREP